MNNRKTAVLITLSFVGFLSYGSSYSVPTPANLQGQATWSPVTAEAHFIGNELTISYFLPEDLVGAGSPGFIAKGKGSGSFIAVAGDDVFGYCMRSAEKPLECMVKYPKKIVDISSRDIALRDHFSGKQLLERMEVARLFSADPAGLLSVELK